MDFKYLKERIKAIYNDWARDRRELMTKVRVTFQEATLSHHLDELRSENVQRQKQLCQVLCEKVSQFVICALIAEKMMMMMQHMQMREWQEKKVEAMQLGALLMMMMVMMQQMQVREWLGERGGDEDEDDGGGDDDDATHAGVGVAGAEGGGYADDDDDDDRGGRRWRR